MSLNFKIIAGIVTLILIAFIVGWIYKRGGDSVQSTIERQNNAATSRADEGVLDYDACRNTGRVWNFGTGKCTGSKVSGRN